MKFGTLPRAFLVAGIGLLALLSGVLLERYGVPARSAADSRPPDRGWAKLEKSVQRHTSKPSGDSSSVAQSSSIPWHTPPARIAPLEDREYQQAELYQQGRGTQDAQASAANSASQPFYGTGTALNKVWEARNAQGRADPAGLVASTAPFKDGRAYMPLIASLPGNTFVHGDQRIAVEQYNFKSTDGDPSFDVTYTPVDPATEVAASVPNSSGSSSRQRAASSSTSFWHEFQERTYEEQLFRARWGWATANLVQRSAP